MNTVNIISSNDEINGKMKEEMKLPIGFRFRPTDEELVTHYLKRKALSLPLPASVIPHLLVFHLDPWSLPGDLKEKRYYFWKRKEHFVSKRSRIIATTSGFWKAVGKEKQLFCSAAKSDVVGTRQTWAFHHCKGQTYGHCSKIRWFMHEFKLLDYSQEVTHEDQVGFWAVCRVFQRKERLKKNGIVAPKRCRNKKNVDNSMEVDSPNYIDFKVDNCINDLGPPLPSSPCSTTD